jgi:hypothetical protein
MHTHTTPQTNIHGSVNKAYMPQDERVPTNEQAENKNYLTKFSNKVSKYLIIHTAYK